MAEPSASDRNAAGRPETTATRPMRRARRTSTSSTPFSGPAPAGSATIGASVPSKSKNSAVVPARSRNGRRAGGSTVPGAT